jgi:amino acid transporter
MASRLRRILLGSPRDVLQPRTYHAISLVALLAWVGLGADGLSSSAYGPDEAFRALGDHRYLAVALALATTLTVATISIAYAQIIKRFPFGGGGYVVATELLGPRWGVVSGSALLVDYVLTISVSIAAAGDQVFSILPPGVLPWKLPIEALMIVLLVLLNLRGVRESVAVLAPVFMVFVVTHAVLVFGGIASHLGHFPVVVHDVGTGFRSGLGTLGVIGLGAVFLRAFTMGAGTFTGIEAVSNGVQIMRDPKIETARRTMLYMAVSLAVTAGGLLIAYLLFDVRPEPGKTMNAVLLQRFAGGWAVAGVEIGVVFVAVSLASEAALLVVAAQAGFLDGPRVMSSMAQGHWLPHRFTQLSERLTVQDGIMLMGGAALLTLWYTKGNVTHLVTMYSINVFVTFSLSQLGMVRYWLGERVKGRAGQLAIHGAALLVCAGILTGTVYEKFHLGGWVTLVVTATLVALCFAIRSHYRTVQRNFSRLDDVIDSVPATGGRPAPALRSAEPTAVLVVGGYSGLGVHALLSVRRLFPDAFANVLFASVAVIDAATMKGVEEVDLLRQRTEQDLRRYVELARRLGVASDYRLAVGTEVVDEGEKLAREMAHEFPRAIFFFGNLVFQKESWFNRLLHNDTAYRLQRRLQFAGLNAMVLPVRVLEPAR